MKYSKRDAKEYAFEHMKGIWAAALTPFCENFSINEEGMRSNFRHWIDDLNIQGLFIAGKQGEFFSMSLDERKRCFEIAVSEAGPKCQTIMSCSDQNFDTVIDLAKHAENIGADYIVVHAPVLNFVSDRKQILINYYTELSSRVNIGIAMWSHPDSGYLMSPQICNEIAKLPNIVAIKYSVPRELYKELTQLAGDNLIVSTASEDEWLDNIEELNWRLYLCSSPPYLYQTSNDKRMREYTDLAFSGNFKQAREVRDSLNPVREAINKTKPAEKPPAHGKYWQELLGQVGGKVRRPMLDLTEDEKNNTRIAFESCGLKL